MNTHKFGTIKFGVLNIGGMKLITIQKEGMLRIPNIGTIQNAD
jgi:hypothetical protein